MLYEPSTVSVSFSALKSHRLCALRRGLNIYTLKYPVNLNWVTRFKSLASSTRRSEVTFLGLKMDEAAASRTWTDTPLAMIPTPMFLNKKVTLAVYVIRF